MKDRPTEKGGTVTSLRQAMSLFKMGAIGGLFVTLFNLLEGPAVTSPALFTAFAAVGLIVVYLL